MDPKELFIFYNKYIKPIYSEIEARSNSLPIELLFETYSSFDHLKRYYIDYPDNDKNQQKEIEKAMSHLQRGVLDAFKLKLKYFNDDLEQLLKTNIDFSLIEEGKYLPKLLSGKKEIIDLAKQARLDERNEDKNIAFNTWLQVSLLINSFEDKFFNEEKIDWAKHQTSKIRNTDRFFNFWSGVLSGILASVIFAIISYLIKIWQF